MGGDLAGAPPGKSPTFLVGAMKDPIGGNLDRIQVVKVWLAKDGKRRREGVRRRLERSGHAQGPAPTAACFRPWATRST